MDGPNPLRLSIFQRVGHALFGIQNYQQLTSKVHCGLTLLALGPYPRRCVSQARLACQTGESNPSC
jgi:hypothetical protein